MNKLYFDALVIVPGEVPGYVRIVISINKTVSCCFGELDGTPGSAEPLSVT